MAGEKRVNDRLNLPTHSGKSNPELTVKIDGKLRPFVDII